MREIQFIEINLLNANCSMSTVHTSNTWQCNRILSEEHSVLRKKEGMRGKKR